MSFDKGGPFIRQMRLIADQIDRAVKSCAAERANGRCCGLPGTDNDGGGHRRSSIIGRGGAIRYLRRGDRVLAVAVEVDKNVVALELDRIGAQILGQRGTQRLAGADIELALVKRAFDLAVFHPAFRQQRKRMGADAVGGVDLAAQIDRARSGFHRR